jgi:hypothetical protein
MLFCYVVLWDLTTEGKLENLNNLRISEKNYRKVEQTKKRKKGKQQLKRALKKL